MHTEKRRVVLDTNIVISAFISQFGAAAQIFEMFLEGNIINYTSEEILQEAEEVIHRLEFTEYIADKKFMIDNLRKLSLIINVTSNEMIVREDPADDKIVNCALDAGADIVSWDNHLLKLKKFRNVKIISPKEFLL